MAKGNRIIVTADPKGVFSECIVDGTPKPGTVMVLKPGQTATVGGRWEYEPAGTTAQSGQMGMNADGDRIPIAILLEDLKIGKLATEAYADGDRAPIYFPLPGEEFNMIIENQSGTADDFVIGTPLMVDDGTGKLLAADSDPQAEPFICQEVLTDLTDDNLTWVLYTGY